jgi:hypothetical protein
VLASYNVNVPSHLCAATTAWADNVTDFKVFLAPSATTGTLVALGRSDSLVAAVAPWTMEPGRGGSSSSSVQLVSCIAHRIPFVNTSTSYESSSSFDDLSAWACADGRSDTHGVHSATLDVPAQCATSLHKDSDHDICHVTVTFMITSFALPTWASGMSVFFPFMRSRIFQ